MGKQGITTKNHNEMRKYELNPYYKTRDFRKKFAPLYIPIITSHAEAANGRFPVFAVSKQEIDRLVRKSASASSFRVKKNNHNKPAQQTSNNFHSNPNAFKVVHNHAGQNRKSTVHQPTISQKVSIREREKEKEKKEEEKRKILMAKEAKPK